MGEGWYHDFRHTDFDPYSPPDFYVRVSTKRLFYWSIRLMEESITFCCLEKLKMEEEAFVSFEVLDQLISSCRSGLRVS